MLTVICETPGILRAEDRPMPVRGDDEVLILDHQVRRAAER